MENFQCRNVRTLIVLFVLLLSEEVLDTAFSRLILSEVVPHSHVADIENKAYYSLSLSEVTPTLKNVLLGDVKGCWTVNLFERSCEEAEMVVLPLEQSRDLIDEFGVRYVRTCLVHSSLVTALGCWISDIIP